MKHLSPARISRFIQSRFNPMRDLTSESLSRHLDAFETGNLRGAALAWDAIEKRDDIMKTVAPKRKKAVARHGWEVLIPSDLRPDQLAQAQQHADALQYFYSNLTCTNALDENERGTFKLLVRQMMDAVGKRYAAHEIVWKPLLVDGPSGPLPRLTAEFRFVPLWFFENRTGNLRLLPHDLALEGEPLEAGAWMITVGEGLMMACSIAWMFKKLPLEHWLDYCQRYSLPALQGTTTAARGTPQWEELASALGTVLTDLSVVTADSETVKVLDLKGSGPAPFEPLVSRMDRLITALWRGSDLSTLSRSQGYGASLQGGETELLEVDDAENISETLNTYVDPWIIKYLFGDQARPLAYIKLVMPPRKLSEQDLAVDEFLLRHGAKLGTADALERYGRAPADPNEETLVLAAAPADSKALWKELKTTTTQS